MSRRLAHLNEVERITASLDERSAWAFAASCAERQWPVYVRASERRRWERRRALREALDSVWRWLSGASARPNDHSARLEAAIPERLETSADHLGWAVAVNTYAFLAELEGGHARDAWRSGQRNVDVLDNFLYTFLGLEVTPFNDIAIDHHELVGVELAAQLEDLALLTGQSLNQEAVRRLKNHSGGSGLLGEAWFQEGPA